MVCKSQKFAVLGSANLFSLYQGLQIRFLAVSKACRRLQGYFTRRKLELQGYLARKKLPLL